ncbi:MAG: ribosomal protein S18-alanine N-acetyltransferase [Firmicutes bacterium]|nr:ribosomal protein S18-alanine N-acetyltransferase [Bacillota bacterium]
MSVNQRTPGEVVQIDFMTLEDIPEVLAIERQSFTTPWSRQAYTSELRDNDRAHYLVARYKDAVIGYIGVWLIGGEGHITNVAVHPQWRNQGVGRLLLQAIEKLVSGFGGERLTLEVRVSNHVAQHLYRSMGFVGVGIRPGYYQDDHEDALIMWKEIDVEK